MGKNKQGLGAKIGQNGKFANFSRRENFMFYSNQYSVGGTWCPQTSLQGLLQTKLDFETKLYDGPRLLPANVVISVRPS